MEGVKSIFASKTIWGGVIAVLAGIAGLFGYNIAAADQVASVETISSIVGSVGGLVAIYGRIKATKVLGNKK